MSFRGIKTKTIRAAQNLQALGYKPNQVLTLININEIRRERSTEIMFSYNDIMMKLCMMVCVKNELFGQPKTP